MNIIKIEFPNSIQVCLKYKKEKWNCKPIFNKTRRKYKFETPKQSHRQQEQGSQARLLLLHRRKRRKDVTKRGWGS